MSESEIESSNKITCLCFHGFNQNADKLTHNLSNMRKKYKNRVQFIIPDAPNLLPNGNCSWWYYSEENPLNIDWNNLFDKITNIDQLIGLNKSLEMVQNLLKNSTIDLYLGFSQGAAFLSLLCQLNIIPESTKKLFFISGFYPLKHLENIKFKIPSLHIF
jgi:predicted esterase